MGLACGGWSARKGESKEREGERGTN